MLPHAQRNGGKKFGLTAASGYLTSCLLSFEPIFQREVQTYPSDTASISISSYAATYQHSSDGRPGVYLPRHHFGGFRPKKIQIIPRPPLGLHRGHRLGPSGAALRCVGRYLPPTATTEADQDHRRGSESGADEAGLWRVSSVALFLRGWLGASVCRRCSV